jgi:DHA1 family bicyclomycin/chloramphenicol resistance-like MFS transporter
VQGFGGAAARVISVAIVRDLFVGRQMARVMSTVMMVFITVPIFAPTIGQALAHAGTWRWPFGVLLAVGVAGMIWAGFRLTETSSRRLPPSFATAVSLVLSSGVTVGYTIAWGLMFGCLVSYISSAQQVFVDVYGLGAAFPVAFGGVACAMALASFTNSRLVQRLGMRRVSHSALVLFVVVASTLSFAASVGQPPFALFGLLLALCFYCFGLIVPNFNAIAMQPMGAVAGTASSLIGFTTTVTGAGLGWAVGRLYDGTVRPLAFGFAALGLLALGCVLLVEGRRGLFRGE